MQLANAATLQLAADWLRVNDPILAPVIARNARPSFEPHTNYYSALVNSIIGQQLSVKAAAAIKQRFADLFGDQMPLPEQILAVSADQLRAIGFSYAKAKYVHDLAQHIIDGRLTFDKISQQTNDEIISALTDVKGVGIWTAQMFLMFCVGRLDILPVGDVGLRNGIRSLYGLTNDVTPADITEIAAQNNWHPYESVASWYVWQSLDNQPKL